MSPSTPPLAPGKLAQLLREQNDAHEKRQKDDDTRTAEDILRGCDAVEIQIREFAVDPRAVQLLIDVVRPFVMASLPRKPIETMRAGVAQMRKSVSAMERVTENKQKEKEK